MATNSSYDTQAMGPSQSTTTTAPPPTGTNAEHILVEPQIVSATFPAAAEPPPGNTNAGPDDPTENDDVDAPPPLGFKLSGYKLLNIVVLFTIGVAKFILSLQGHSIAPTGLDWAGGCVLAILLYWIGLYEAAKPPRWRWFLHVDWAPGIGFTSKRFLVGVLLPFTFVWQTLPFWVAYSIFHVHVAFLDCTPLLAFVYSYLSASSFSLLYIALPTKWLVWHHIPVWAPVRRFFQVYGSWSGNPAGGQYQLIGNVGFRLGLLSGGCLLYWLMNWSLMLLAMYRAKARGWRVVKYEVSIISWHIVVRF